MMTTWIVALIVVVALAAAIRYIYRAKKRGVKCIGCPDSATCSGHCAGCSGCSKSKDAESKDAE